VSLQTLLTYPMPPQDTPIFGALNLDCRAWRHGLVHPFYVPSELRQVRALLSTGNISAAIDELSTRAANGSSNAAATLEYICLRDPNLPRVDYWAVASLCRASASRSHAYSQYVLACREYQRGNFKEYSRWLYRAARQNFPPAICDIGRAFVERSSDSRKNAPLAKRFLARAFVRGHLLSGIYFLRACREGTFGSGMSVLGHVALPVALLLIAPICRLRPFSASLFSHPFGVDKPLFAQSLSSAQQSRSQSVDL